jgi:hypothetical protein
MAMTTHKQLDPHCPFCGMTVRPGTAGIPSGNHQTHCGRAVCIDELKRQVERLQDERERLRNALRPLADKQYEYGCGCTLQEIHDAREALKE